MNTDLWPNERICIRSSGGEVGELAKEVYQRVCRTEFTEPGFCLVNCGATLGSVAFRQLMVDLKHELALVHQQHSVASTLIYVSATRFDQQVSTKPHIDGGPAACFLMLGYEPTVVQSSIELADYSRCAYDLGITPRQFLNQHNPMFQSGQKVLQPYTSRLCCFSPDEYQIVCINNSTCDYQIGDPAWQGVLHTATIIAPDESKRRIINSTMIAAAPLGDTDRLSAHEQHEFIHTNVVRRKGYDKLHLEDDG